MDSIDLNVVGLSERFRIIRFQNVSFCQKIVLASSNWADNCLQTIFEGNFQTKPFLKNISKSFETMNLQVKIKHFKISGTTTF